MSNDNTINLREPKDDSDPEFKIKRFEDDEKEVPEVKEVSGDFVARHASVENAHDKVRVKFGKFVNLVLNQEFEDIFHRHMETEIIMDSDLLTDLASAQDRKKDRKLPLIFLGGIVLGIAVAWFILKT